MKMKHFPYRNYISYIALQTDYRTQVDVNETRQSVRQNDLCDVNKWFPFPFSSHVFLL